MPPRKKQPRNATQLLDDLRDTMGKGVHHVLAFGDTLVKKRTTMTAKQLATETVEFAFKSGELTIDAYKNAYNLFFPRKGRR